MRFRRSAGIAAVLLCALLAAGCSEKRIATIRNGEIEQTATPVTEVAPGLVAEQGEDGERSSVKAEFVNVTATQPETEAPETTEVPTTVPPTTEEPTTEAPTTTVPPTTVSPNVGLTALAQVPGYVNVRSGPTTEDEIVGKIYDDCAAEILDEVEGEDGSWFLMTSGNVKGYIKSEYFLVGEEAEKKREEVGVLMGTVNVEWLRVRSAPDLDDPDNVFTYYQEGTEVFIDEMTDDGWAKITTDEASTGYVYGECMDIERVFKTAITLEEEQAEIERKLALEEAARKAEEEYQAALEAERLAKEEAERKAAEEAARKAREEAEAAEAARRAAEEASRAAEQAAQSGQPAPETPPAETPAPEAPPAETPAPEAPPAPVADSNAALREAVCAYALQFLGNPYVHAGRSLVTGTDCSGFTSLVYQHFGIMLSYAPEGQQYQGTLVMNAPVDINALLPGDLLFWPSSTKSVGHVGLYLGNNQFIHAASPARGVCLETFTAYRPALFARRIIN